MLVQLAKEGGVLPMSGGESVAQAHHLWSEQLDAFLCSLIGHVIAPFVFRRDQACLDHVLCGMALDLGDPH